ncbi:anti-sigma factor domain-containing protein [Streptomyces sp. NPDC020681]|uniref:anti-sigma factor n=1 Tax=Streptomyces sp. NPDC020681 TaxID=3365083 RepID=UPI0037919495
MTTADLHTLTGAYVLHALASDERAEFERHLDDCPACSLEVRELAATVAKLGLAAAVTPPPALKQQVMRRVSAERQEPPRVRRGTRGTRGRRGRSMSRFVLAACVAAAVAFGGVAVWQHQEAEDARQSAQRSQQETAELAAVLAAPDAQVTTSKLKDGAHGTVVVSQSRNKAAFLASGLAKPPSGKVYQLWYEDGGKMRPAGLMDPNATDNAVLMEGALDSASGMGITVEPAGGSAEPTTDPVALLRFPA